MEKKLITNCFYVNFILTKKFKGFELDGNVSMSFYFEKCGTKNAVEDKIFYFENEEEYFKISFGADKRIYIFAGFENESLSYALKREDNDFEKIKNFFSEIVTEINENDGN